MLRQSVCGFALTTGFLFLGCAAHPPQKATTSQPAVSQTAALAMNTGMWGVRTCDDVKGLGRPTVSGTSCVPIDGGFVALIATSKSESWNDSDGAQHYDYVMYDIWAYRPARKRPAGGKAGSADADHGQPERIRWRDQDVCKEGSGGGGGESSEAQCSIFLVHDLDDDGELEIVIKRFESSMSAGCCTSPSQSYHYAFYTIEDETLVPSKRYPTLERDDDTLTVVDYDHDGRPDLYSKLDYKIPASCDDTPGFLLHSLPGGRAVARRCRRQERRA